MRGPSYFSEMPMRNLVLFLLPGLIWGSEWMIARDLDGPPLGALAWRYSIAALMLGAFLALRRIRWPSRRQVLLAGISGIGFAALPAVLTGWASNHVSPGLSVVILAMTPLAAALMEGRASGWLLNVLIGGVGGTALLASQGLSFSLNQLPGALAILMAVMLIAWSVISVKRRLADVSVVMIAAIQLAFGAVIVALSSFLLEGAPGFAFHSRDVSAQVLRAIAGSAVALPLYYWILRRMESFQLTASQWVATNVSLAESLSFARQAPGWRILAGGLVLLVSLGVLLSNRSDEDTPLTIGATLPRIVG